MPKFDPYEDGSQNQAHPPIWKGTRDNPWWDNHYLNAEILLTREDKTTIGNQFTRSKIATLVKLVDLIRTT